MNGEKSRNKDNEKKSTTLYEKIDNEIKTEWPTWKKEAYNSMFAVSAHATKV